MSDLFDRINQAQFLQSQSSKVATERRAEAEKIKSVKPVIRGAFQTQEAEPNVISQITSVCIEEFFDEVFAHIAKHYEYSDEEARDIRAGILNSNLIAQNTHQFMCDIITSNINVPENLYKICMNEFKSGRRTMSEHVMNENAAQRPVESIKRPSM